MGDWALGGNNPRNLLVFGAAVALGGLSYLLVASALRAPELQDMLQALRRRKRA